MMLMNNDDLVKVENAPGWVKSSENKAVLNTNKSALVEYKIKKQKSAEINKMKSDVDCIKDDMDSLKSEVTEIKCLLIDFIRNSHNK